MAYELVHHARIAEAHFDLGWMYVDIDRARIDREEEHIGRLAVAMQQFRISLADRMRDHAVAHVAAIDEEILRIGPCLCGLRRACEARERHAAGAGLDSDGCFSHFTAEEGRSALGQGLRAHMPACAAV